MNNKIIDKCETYLGSIHHTDVANIAIAEAEENVTDDENYVTLKNNTGGTPTLWHMLHKRISGRKLIRRRAMTNTT